MPSGTIRRGAIGFNTAFAPTWDINGYGIIGDPFYGPGFFLGGFSANAGDPATDAVLSAIRVEEQSHSRSLDEIQAAHSTAPRTSAARPL